MNFISHTLIALQDMGASIKYPIVNHVCIDSDGKSSICNSSVVRLSNRVTIEQNQLLKFIIMFSLFDAYIDSIFPILEGKTFRKKYDALTNNDDFHSILKSLFRIARVIRNAITHNQSDIEINTEKLCISYQRKNNKTKVPDNFSIDITLSSLCVFHTALAMYIQGDMGKGSYFLGIMRTMYSEIINGIKKYSDDIGYEIKRAPCGLYMNANIRDIVTNQGFSIVGRNIKINKYELGFKCADVNNNSLTYKKGADFYIIHKNHKLLIPSEALDERFMIDEMDAIENWKAENRFPAIRQIDN